MGSINRDIEINQMFPVPPGVIDVHQEYNESTSSGVDEADATTADQAVADDTSLSPLVPTVTSMSISKQDIRFTTDGRAVVDVTASFPVPEDVLDLEVQLTKT